MDDVIQRGINAQVLVTTPFWREIMDHAKSLELAALEQMKGARHADALTVKALQNRWLAISDTVNSVLSLPYAAIDAAGDATPQGSDWLSAGDEQRQQVTNVS